MKKTNIMFERELEEKVLSQFNFTNSIYQLTFDKTRLKSNDEKTVFCPSERVQYVIPMSSISGLVCVTDQRVYFQPAQATFLDKPLVGIKLAKIKQLFKRRYTHMNIAIEIIADKKKNKQMYLVFKSKEIRD
jgi:hypothetical protein